METIASTGADVQWMGTDAIGSECRLCADCGHSGSLAHRHCAIQSCLSSACQRMVGSAGERYKGILISLGSRWATRAMASTRRLIVILAADVAGSSRLMGADAEGRWRTRYQSGSAA